jgi:hypothetical protein
MIVDNVILLSFIISSLVIVGRQESSNRNRTPRFGGKKVQIEIECITIHIQDDDGRGHSIIDLLCTATNNGHKLLER